MIKSHQFWSEKSDILQCYVVYHIHRVPASPHLLRPSRRRCHRPHCIPTLSWSGHRVVRSFVHMRWAKWAVDCEGRC
jgi:hypothetical protein